MIYISSMVMPPLEDPAALRIYLGHAGSFFPALSSAEGTNATLFVKHNERFSGTYQAELIAFPSCSNFH